MTGDVKQSCGITPHQDVEAHLREVGLLCTQWAYLEWLLEVAVWWLLNLLDDRNDGRLITESFQADKLALMARGLAHRKLANTEELNAMKHIASEIVRLTGERNLAVHGLREVRPDETALASVGRGKYKNTPQVMPLVRLRTLNTEVAKLVNIIEPLLAKHGVIGSSGPVSKPATVGTDKEPDENRGRFRGFHRLGFFLPAIILVAGVVASSFMGVQRVNRAREDPEYIKQAELACAQDAVRKAIAPQLGISKREAELPRQVLERKVSLNQLGCSDERKIVTVAEVLDARAPDALTYFTVFLGVFSLGLGITVAFSMAVYGLVRTVGRAIGRFMAS